MNIGTLLSRHARYRPDHVAVVFENRRLTYREFNRGVNRLANALLNLGVGKGDKVAVILPNCVELLEIYWAVAKMGAVVVPLSTLLRGKGLTTLLLDSDATMVVTNTSFVEILDSLKPNVISIPSDRYFLTDASDQAGYQDYQSWKGKASDSEPQGASVFDEDPFNIMYSSGTTGLPKGIIHTHYVRANYCRFASSFRMTPESITLQAGSIVFNGAFVTLMPTLFLGATYVLQQQFNPEAFIEAVEREQVTHTMMVPSQIIAILHASNFSAERLSSLEMLLSLGAPLHRQYKEEIHRRLPGRFYELYGLTEGFITILDRNDFPRKLDSVGVPPPLYEMRILNGEGKEAAPREVGEIVGRGPILMPGYYKRPDLTQETIIDGWLHSGDLGYVAEDGFLYLVDRQKDMIISGGVNVYPKDIEEVIVQHPAVREAAVFGIPSEKWGETPLAAVILRQPGLISPENLRDWINERVEARFQRVHAVVLMEDFPRNVAGKTLKRVMREPYWAGRDTKI